MAETTRGLASQAPARVAHRSAGGARLPGVEGVGRQPRDVDVVGHALGEQRRRREAVSTTSAASVWLEVQQLRGRPQVAYAEAAGAQGGGRVGAPPVEQQLGAAYQLEGGAGRGPVDQRLLARRGGQGRRGVGRRRGLPVTQQLAHGHDRPVLAPDQGQGPQPDQRPPTASARRPTWVPRPATSPSAPAARGCRAGRALAAPRRGRRRGPPAGPSRGAPAQPGRAAPRAARRPARRTSRGAGRRGCAARTRCWRRTSARFYGREFGQDARAAGTERSRPRVEVWYVSYGSNMSSARLAAYLAGGVPPGGTRQQPRRPRRHPATAQRPGRPARGALLLGRLAASGAAASPSTTTRPAAARRRRVPTS